MDMDRQADEAWILSVQRKLYQWSQENPGDQWRDSNRSAPPFGQAGIGEGGAPRLALATAFSIKPHGSCCRRRQVSMTLRMAA